MTTTSLLRLAAAGTVLAVYYLWLVQDFDRAAVALAQRLGWGRSLSNREMESVSSVAVATPFQLAVLGVLVGITGYDAEVAAVLPTILELSLGILLGLGQMSSVSFLCYVAVRALTIFAASNTESTRNWVDGAMRSGWVRSFFDVRRVLPPVIWLPLTALYIGTEEFIFRGPVQSLFAAMAPPPVAVLLTTLVFMFCQVAGMHSLSVAFFPIVGAAVGRGRGAGLVGIGEGGVTS